MIHNVIIDSKYKAMTFNLEVVHWKEKERGRLLLFNYKSMEADKWFKEFKEQYKFNNWKGKEKVHFINKLGLALSIESYKWFELYKETLAATPNISKVKKLFLNEFKTI